MGGGQVCNNSRPFKGEGFASLSAKILGISDGPGFVGLWQYRLLNFKGGCTKLEFFLIKINIAKKIIEF